MNTNFDNDNLELTEQERLYLFINSQSQKEMLIDYEPTQKTLELLKSNSLLHPTK
jgi:uncharacterized protein YqkB